MPGYYAFVALVLIIAGPFLLIAYRKTRLGLAQKFGQVPESVKAGLPEDKPRIWLHAVSVGEFNAIYPLLLELRRRLPEFHYCVSTTTATGQQLAQDKVGSWATVFYFPFDLPFCTNAWLDAIRPAMVAIAETEIWPGFTYECNKRGILLTMVNARISPRSFKRYKALSSIFTPVLRRFAGIAAQTDTEAQRFVELGAQNVQICGNMKFDGIAAVPDYKQQELRSLVNLRKDDLVLVAGSTHEGEEAAILKAMKSVPSCKLIIAPRHPERFDKVTEYVASFGFRPRRYSLGEQLEQPGDVFILDTIGQLTAFYSLATVAFVGGTLVPIGGHSLVEPCAYAIPVLAGPHYFKTKDVAKALIGANALTIVKDEKELSRTLTQLLESKDFRMERGVAGAEFLSQNQGAVRKTESFLEEILFESIRKVQSGERPQPQQAAARGARS